MNKIAILDFGSQYAHLIATRIRRLGVYSEILEPSSATSDTLKTYKGIILSGAPSRLRQDAPTVDHTIFTLSIPILGVCYGHQLITHLAEEKWNRGKGSEFGKPKSNQKTGRALPNFSPNEKTDLDESWRSRDRPSARFEV